MAPRTRQAGYVDLGPSSTLFVRCRENVGQNWPDVLNQRRMRNLCHDDGQLLDGIDQIFLVKTKKLIHRKNENWTFPAQDLLDPWPTLISLLSATLVVDRGVAKAPNKP